MLPVDRPQTVPPVEQTQTVPPVERPQTELPMEEMPIVLPVEQPQTVMLVEQPRTVLPVQQTQDVRPVEQPETVLPVERPQEETLTVPMEQTQTAQHVEQPQTVLLVVRPQTVPPVEQTLTVPPVEQPQTEQPVEQPQTELPMKETQAVPMEPMEQTQTALPVGQPQSLPPVEQPQTVLPQTILLVVRPQTERPVEETLAVPMEQMQTALPVEQTQAELPVEQTQAVQPVERPHTVFPMAQKVVVSMGQTLSVLPVQQTQAAPSAGQPQQQMLTVMAVELPQNLFPVEQTQEAAQPMGQPGTVPPAKKTQKSAARRVIVVDRKPSGFLPRTLPLIGRHKPLPKDAPEYQPIVLRTRPLPLVRRVTGEPTAHQDPAKFFRPRNLPPIRRLRDEPTPQASSFRPRPLPASVLGHPKFSPQEQLMRRNAELVVTVARLTSQLKETELKFEAAVKRNVDLDKQYRKRGQEIFVLKRKLAMFPRPEKRPFKDVSEQTKRNRIKIMIGEDWKTDVESKKFVFNSLKAMLGVDEKDDIDAKARRSVTVFRKLEVSYKKYVEVLRRLMPDAFVPTHRLVSTEKQMRKERLEAMKAEQAQGSGQVVEEAADGTPDDPMLDDDDYADMQDDFELDPYEPNCSAPALSQGVKHPH